MQIEVGKVYEIKFTHNCKMIVQIISYAGFEDYYNVLILCDEDEVHSWAGTEQKLALEHYSWRELSKEELVLELL